MRGTTWAAGAAVALLLLSACSDDAGTDGDDGGDGAEAATTIEAAATEFQFDPDAWTVPAGEESTIEFTNDGEVEHEWAVIALGEDIGSEDEFTEEKVVFEVEAIPAGEVATETFTLDEPGTYQVICALAGHFDAGMEGTLEVTG